MNITAKLMILLALILVANPSWGELDRGILTSNVSNREPVDDLGNQVVSDGSNSQQVFYFTHLKQLEGTQIQHRWYYRGKEMATVTLNIGSNDWRTYSSKRLLPNWIGEWKIEVWNGDLKIQEHNFTFLAQ